MSGFVFIGDGCRCPDWWEPCWLLATRWPFPWTGATRGVFKEAWMR